MSPSGKRGAALLDDLRGGGARIPFSPSVPGPMIPPKLPEDQERDRQRERAREREWEQEKERARAREEQKTRIMSQGVASAIVGGGGAKTKRREAPLPPGMHNEGSGRLSVLSGSPGSEMSASERESQSESDRERSREGGKERGRVRERDYVESHLGMGAMGVGVLGTMGGSASNLELLRRRSPSPALTAARAQREKEREALRDKEREELREREREALRERERERERMFGLQHLGEDKEPKDSSAKKKEKPSSNHEQRQRGERSSSPAPVTNSVRQAPAPSSRW
jgi:RNA-binding protein 25